MTFSIDSLVVFGEKITISAALMNHIHRRACSHTLSDFQTNIVEFSSVFMKVERLALPSCVCRTDVKPCAAPFTAPSANLSAFVFIYFHFDLCQ